MSLVKLAMKLVGKTGKNTAVTVMSNMINSIANAHGKKPAIKIIAQTKNAGQNRKIFNNLTNRVHNHKNERISNFLEASMTSKLSNGGRAIKDEIL